MQIHELIHERGDHAAALTLQTRHSASGGLGPGQNTAISQMANLGEYMGRTIEESALHQITPIVLIVIPQLDELAVMSRLLYDAGYVRQECTSDFAKACDIVTSRSISIVLADYGDTTWLELLQATRLKSPTARVTFGLGFSQLGSSLSDMVLQEGAYNVLGRPYHKSEVLQALGFARQAWDRESSLQVTKIAVTQKSHEVRSRKVRRSTSVARLRGRACFDGSLVLGQG